MQVMAGFPDRKIASRFGLHQQILGCLQSNPYIAAESPAEVGGLSNHNTESVHALHASRWIRSSAVTPACDFHSPAFGSWKRTFADLALALLAWAALSGHRQNAFASFSTLDRLQFERRRKLTVLSNCCHRSSSK
jgi:hypothetical protein